MSKTNRLFAVVFAVLLALTACATDKRYKFTIREEGSPLPGPSYWCNDGYAEWFENGLGVLHLFNCTPDDGDFDVELRDGQYVVQEEFMFP